MTGSNKILTVSYGTFSCTLEGFDEPFETMRGIAEYFRDLAADDRYFGAEPPTPDVEMLQSIAEREVQRRVAARTSETGIALTQMQEPAPAAPKPRSEPAPAEKPTSAATAAPAVKAEEFDSGPLAFDDDYLLADEPEDVLTVDDTIPPAAETDRVETVAEKLRRIRAVVSRSIEPEGAPQSFSAAPGADGDAGAARIRSRAQTRTIDSITADLSDEDVFDGEEEDDLGAEKIREPDDAVVEEDDLEDLARIDGLDSEAEAVDIENLMAPDLAPEAEPSGNAFDEAEDEEAEDDGSSDEALIASVLQSGATEPEAAEESESAPATEAKPSRPRPEITDTDDNVDRLLKETDSKLADDAGIRRRRVISQMRAAVAATKAERVLSRVLPRGKAEAEAEETSPYKDDLKKVITRKIEDTPPARSAVSEISDEEPAASEEVHEAEASAKPPPLVLVSSQRVDEPEDVFSEADGSTGGFREFAREMGASELPDLMEAAAAYTAFVEGQSHFSRPEIMKRVAAVDPALEISREAGLRSFGQLLRQGKIKKLDRGQFVIDEETRFNPSHRIAGE